MRVGGFFDRDEGTADTVRSVRGPFGLCHEAPAGSGPAAGDHDRLPRWSFDLRRFFGGQADRAFQALQDVSLRILLAQLCGQRFRVAGELLVGSTLVRSKSLGEGLDGGLRGHRHELE